MGLLLLAFTLFGGAAAVYFMVKARNQRDYSTATRIGLCLLAWLGAYMLALLAVSILAPANKAGGGEVHFCGIDPACDLYATIEQVGYAKTLGNPPRELIAQGRYCIITVKVRSQSAKPDLKPDLTGTVVDSKGQEYSSFRDAELIVRQQQAASGQAAPRAGAWRAVMVFDVPDDIDRPALVLHAGSVFERLLELFIVGDEASLLHPDTKLRFMSPEEQRKL